MSFCSMAVACAVYDARLRVAGVCISASICEGCRNRATSELRMLRIDYVDLSQEILKNPVKTDVRIFRPRPQSSPPLDMQVLTLRHDIANAAILADAALRRRFGPPGPRWSGPVREGVALDHALRHLEANVERLAGLGAIHGCWDLSSGLSEALSGPQVLLRMGMLHRRARTVLGLAPVTITLPGECPSCRVPALRRHDDDPERIWCAACKAKLDRNRYISAIGLRNDS